MEITKVDDIERSVVRIFNKPFNQLPICKDVPRLVKRFEFVPAGPVPSDSDDLPVMQRIIEAVWHISSQVETQAEQDRIRAIEPPKKAAGDLQLEVDHLFTSIGHDTPTARVFKVVHQNHLMAGVEYLKATALKDTLTKDIRDPRGWRIVFEFLHGGVAVTHIRREQSVPLKPDDANFEMEWQLRVTFDAEVQTVQAVLLRITELQFLEGTTNHQRDLTRSRLGHGNILV